MIPICFIYKRRRYSLHTYLLIEKKEITLSLSGFVGFGVPLVVEKKIAIFQI